MTRETVLATLQLVETMRQNGAEVQRIVGDAALQVGDRHILDHALSTIRREVDVLSRTLTGMLDDATRTE